MRRRRFLWGGAALCVGLFAAGAMAADAGRERLEGVRAAYRNLRAFSCLVTVTTSADDAKTPPFKADVAIRFPDRAAVACGDGETTFRAVGGPNGRQIRALNGAVTPERDAKPATIADVLRDARLSSTLLARILAAEPLASDSDAVTDAGTATSDSGPIRRLILRRKAADGTNAAELVTLEIGEKDSLLRRATVTIGEGAGAFQRTEIYTEVAANPDLPDSLFALVTDPAAPGGKKKFARPVRESVPEKQRRQIFDAGAFNPLDRPEIVHDFPLKNVSDRPLVLRRIEAACGCTTALLGPVVSESPANVGEQTSLTVPGDTAVTLPPGAETTIRVTLRSASIRRDDFGKSVTIWADGAPQPVAQLTISGEILPAVALPPSVEWGEIPSGKGASREITVWVDRRLAGATPPTLTSDGPRLKAAFVGTETGSDKAKPDASGVIHRYRVTLPPSAPLGIINETLTLTPAPDAPKSDGAQKDARQNEENAQIWKAATAPVSGMVVGDVAANPPSLNFGVVIGGRERSLPVTLIYKSGKPDASRKIAAVGPHLTVTPGKKSGGAEMLTITVRKDAPNADLRSEVTVTLSNGQVLVIPVVGYVQAVAPANLTPEALKGMVRSPASGTPKAEAP